MTSSSPNDDRPPLSTEDLILQHLVQNNKFHRSVLPHLETSYFTDRSRKTLFEIIRSYSEQHNILPPKSSLAVELDEIDILSEDDYKKSRKLISAIYRKADDTSEAYTQWLEKKTEKFCLDRSVYLAIMESITIIDGEDKKQRSKDAIPHLLQEALSVTFDKSVGHDYLEDMEKRYEFYHKIEKRYKFPLTMLNKITKGGLPPSSLGLILAPTGVGKTLGLTDFSAFWLQEGYNVLYISLEMAEMRISERIDAKLLNVEVDALKSIMEKTYKRKLTNIASKTMGKLIVKQYPAHSINVNHIEALLQELKTKKNFVPDIICLDYLNLLASCRMKSADNSYNYVKAVGEEFRGLMVKHDILGMSATQTNRDGNGASDYDLNEISDSFGTAMTADFIVALISTPDLEKLGQIRWKQLKNRFGPLNNPSSFISGIERGKMKFFDLDLPKSP